jgi:hypothetical protein
MVVSANTIERWKEQLASNERLLTSESDRFKWIRKLYVRLYQFLLNRYGDDAEHCVVYAATYHDGNPGSSMPFVDLTSDHRGLQARSPEALRYALEKIHSHQPQPAKSGIHSSSTANEFIVVATSQTLRISSCEIVLRISQIPFRKRRHGPDEVLEVPFELRDAAFAAIKSFPKKDLRRKRSDRWNVALIPKFLMTAILLVILGLLLVLLATVTVDPGRF